MWPFRRAPTESRLNMGLFQSWRCQEAPQTLEQLEKAELAKTLDDIGLARFFGRYMSGVLSNDQLALEVIKEHRQKAEDQGTATRVLKAIFS